MPAHSGTASPSWATTAPTCCSTPRDLVLLRSYLGDHRSRPAAPSPATSCGAALDLLWRRSDLPFQHPRHGVLPFLPRRPPVFPAVSPPSTSRCTGLTSWCTAFDMATARLHRLDERKHGRSVQGPRPCLDSSRSRSARKVWQVLPTFLIETQTRTEPLLVMVTSSTPMPPQPPTTIRSQYSAFAPTLTEPLRVSKSARCAR